MNVYKIYWLALFVSLVGLGFISTNAQNNLQISGMAIARSGMSIANTVVIACFVVNDDCDETLSKTTLISGNGKNANYAIGELENKDYVLLAWQDSNKNQALDSGDELGVYQKNGQVFLVRPPAQNINLQLNLFNGDLAAILEQNSTTSSPNSKPSSNSQTKNQLSFSGRINTTDFNNTIVLASVWENGKYNQRKTKAAKPDASGQFVVSGLEKISYVLVAWRDVDNNGDIGANDEIAPFRNNGKLALATPPLGNIELVFEQGDKSFDALVAMTLANPTTGTAPAKKSGNNSSATQIASAFTPIDCGKKDAFFGDYGCIVPAVDSYVGNNKCPIRTSFPSVSSEKGFFKGHVYDSCNRPLSNVEVRVGQTSFGGQKATTKTDNKGFYRLESQFVVGAYVYAYIKTNFAGNDYGFSIKPENEIIGREGGVQNIQYTTRDSQLWFYTEDFYKFNLPKGFGYEFVLEPTKLIDGTTGRKQKFQYKDIGGPLKFTGIKQGMYNLSVFVVTANNRFKTYLYTRSRSENSETIPVILVGTDVVTVTIRLEP